MRRTQSVVTRIRETTDANWRVVYLLSAGLVLAAGWPTLFYPFGRDQGIHATIGYSLGEGLITYRDVFNIKPPLTTAVHFMSQWVFGQSMFAIRAFDLVFAMMAATGLVSIVRRCGLPPAAGAFAVLGLVMIYHAQSYWTLAQTDGWAGFLVIAAVVAMLSGWAQPAGLSRYVRMGLAGAMFGLAFALKYTIGVCGILVFAPLLAGREARFLISDFLAVVGGGIAVLAVLILTMAAAGALGPFLEIQSYIRGYVRYDAIGNSIIPQIYKLLWNNTTAAVVTLGVLAWLWNVSRGEAPLFNALVALWVPAAALSGFVQSKGFAYQFLPLTPPYALLVGLAGWRFLDLLPRLGIRRPVLISCLAATGIALASGTGNMLVHGLIAVAGPTPTKTIRDTILPVPDFDIHATLAFSKILADQRAPDDRLFVWGYDAMLYFLQDEPPRYRYPYSWPFVVDFHDGRYTEDLLERLEAAPPRHIVVQKRDAAPLVTGRSMSSKEFLSEFQPLATFISTRYRQTENLPRFELWEIVE